MSDEIALPDSKGHWRLDYPDGQTSFWDVWMRNDWPYDGTTTPVATNENQTDPCSWLGMPGCTWTKIGEEYHGRLA